MRKLLLILLMMCAMLAPTAAQDIRAMFMDAPDEVLPLLPRNARADCVDLADAAMLYPVSNMLGGKSTLKVLSDNYLLLQTTGASTMEMKLLPHGDDFVICVIKSVLAEVADSRIAFYDKNWKKLDTSLFFTSPSIKEFFNEPDEKVLDICDMYLVSLRLNETNNFIVAEYTMPGYMNSDDASKVRQLLKTISYRWDGNMFVKE